MSTTSKTFGLVAAVAAAAALAGWDHPRPRPDAAAPAVAPAAAPAAPAAPATAAPLSEGLSKRTEFPGFYLDHIGPVLDPMNKPAVVPANTPLVFDGFG